MHHRCSGSASVDSTRNDLTREEQSIHRTHGSLILNAARTVAARPDGGKEQVKCRALSRVAGDVYVSPDPAHESADLRDAQSGPQLPLGRKEGLEYFLEHVLGHTRPIVSDPDPHVVDGPGVRGGAFCCP